MSAVSKPSKGGSPKRATDRDRLGPPGFLFKTQAAVGGHSPPTQTWLRKQPRPNKPTSLPSEPTEPTTRGQPRRPAPAFLPHAHVTDERPRPGPRGHACSHLGEHVCFKNSRGGDTWRASSGSWSPSGQTGWRSPPLGSAHPASTSAGGPDACVTDPTRAQLFAPCQPEEPAAFLHPSPQVPADGCCPALQLLHPPAAQVLRGRR